MRDLNLNELEMVYGASGCGLGNSPTPPSTGCGDSPTPPTCGGGGTKRSHKGTKRSNKGKSKRSHKRSKGKRC